MNLPKTQVADPVALWFLFVENFGDLGQTARAAGVALSTLQGLADAGNWPAKLLTVAGPSPGDVAVVTANRAINLAQSHRLRLLAESVLERLADNPDVLEEFTTTNTPMGSNRTLKPLAELAKVIEIAQDLSYRALADDGTADLGKPSSVADATEAVAKALQLGRKTVPKET